MENKFYTLIFLVFFAGLSPARAQDSSSCTAQFFISYSSTGNTVYFRAADSAAGVQHYWNFGDTAQLGFGNYVSVTHTYHYSGSFVVTHKTFNPSTGCHDSTTQVVNPGVIPASCEIFFAYSHDSTQKNASYYFYGAPYANGAANDTVTWTINGSVVRSDAQRVPNQGDTLVKYLSPGTYAVCATLKTSLGCQSQYCQSIYVSDSTGSVPPKDSTRPVPPDSSINPGGPRTPPDSNVIVLPNLPADSVAPGDSLVATSPDSAHLLVAYPNPASSAAYVNLQLSNPQMVYIRVYNSMGNEVGQQQVSGYTGNNHISIPMAGLQSGIYVVQLQFGNTIKRSRIQKL